MKQTFCQNNPFDHTVKPMNLPDNLRYALTHEWIRQEGDEVITGITDHAQEALGDLVHVELPAVGSRIEAGQPVGVVESVKTASDIHAPVSGVIVAINPLLEDEPEVVNESPYERGWLYRIQPDQPVTADALHSGADYAASVT